MRRLLHFVARLYPASWRARYGDEFHAVLDDMTPRWRDNRIRIAGTGLGGGALLGVIVAFFWRRRSPAAA